MISDFEQVYECPQLYQKISGLGCVKFFILTGHTFDTGFAECQKDGAEPFEFDDFQVQHQLFYNFMTAKGREYRLSCEIYGSNNP